MNTKITTTIVIIILLILGAWAVFGTNNVPTLPPTDLGTDVVISDDGIITTDSGETIDTSDWVTYRNEEMGFEVKHPEGWGVTSGDHDSSNGKATMFMFGPVEIGQGDINVTWIATRYHLSGSAEQFAEEAAENSLQHAADTTYFHKQTNTQLKGVETSLLNARRNSLDEQVAGHNTVFLSSNGVVWDFPFSGYFISKDSEAYSPLHRAIFDTFTFLDSSE